MKRRLPFGWLRLRTRLQFVDYIFVERLFLETGAGAGKINQRDLCAVFFKGLQDDSTALVVRQTRVVNHRKIIKSNVKLDPGKFRGSFWRNYFETKTKLARGGVDG